MYAYVTLKENVELAEDDIIVELKTLVKTQIGSFAVPEIIQVRVSHSDRYLFHSFNENRGRYL